MTKRSVLFFLLLSTSALAQNLRVVPVPSLATDLTVPHAAYNGHATTFKAIARGGNGTYTVDWDFQGDGVYDFSTAANRYNLSTRFTYPPQAATTTFNAKVRVTSNGQTVTGIYPVRVYADVPANPANANSRQLQIMRAVSIDDALWRLHTLLFRTGNEEDPLTGAQALGNLGSSWADVTNPMFLEALGRLGHYPAFPAAYLGAIPDPGSNTARWRDDPYAEDAMRVLNQLLAQSTATSVATSDESNLTGFYPEVSATPIPGTDDGLGLYVGPSSNRIGGTSGFVRALAVSNLTGFVAQTGDPNRILGRRFEFLLQQYVDSLVWAQNEGTYTGSWYYTPNGGNDLLGELGDGVMDAIEALATAEEQMGGAGIIVPNLVKARLLQYVQQDLNSCPAGGTGGTIVASSDGVCDFANSAAILFALRWIGAQSSATTDSRLAFPGYNGLTRGQLRGWHDSTITFISTVFNGTSVGTYNWDNGFVEGGNWDRVDGLGDHYSMIHWARAARIGSPEIVNFGNNDWARLFSRYLVNNQLSDGNWSWAFSTPLSSNSDSILGADARVLWSALTLIGDSRAPFVIGQSSVTSAPEGTPIDFQSTAETPGTVVWAFGNGATATGANVTYAYPDNGMYNATVTETSADGQVSVDTIPVTINNVAPVTNAGPDLTVNEGAALPFSLTFTDPGLGDTFTYSWNFGDGTTANSQNVNHVFRDSGTFNVTARVTDDDGGTSVDTVVVTVNNLAPTITSTPGTLAQEGNQYSYVITFTDPGALDTHTCSAPIKPAGAALVGCQVVWTPDYSNSSSNAFRVCVTDDDGGQDCQSFTVTATYLDSDGDGLPDSWEISNFGNIVSQDQFGDPDADGRNNLQEFEGVTDPLTYDGPSAPSAAAPSCGITVAAYRPALVVNNASSTGAPLSYQFEVYTDPALTQLAASTSGVASGPGATTSWTVDTTLAENGSYSWRARASDGVIWGPWSPVCAFAVSVTDELPSAPEIDGPNFGAVVSSQPTLTVKNAIDPEGDPLGYEFEVRQAGAIVASAQGVSPGTGLTSWQVSATLTTGTDYLWRARAVSSGGASPWSELGLFHVAKPSTGVRTPTIVSPQNGTTVSSLNPSLVFLQDGDVGTFDWELATSESFGTVVETATNVSSTRITLANALTEDSRYCWRVRSNDGQVQSAWSSACFTVSVTDGAPSVPTLHNPSNDSVASTLTPVFSWAASVDPEGSPATYELELSQGSSVVATVTAIGGTAAIAPEPLSDGATYSWRVRSVSGSAKSDYSSPNIFRVELPAAPAPRGCGCGSAPGLAFLPALLLGLARRRRRRASGLQA